MALSIATSGIVSQAFRLLEMQPISSFGDSSEQALSAEATYPVALDACLEAVDWSFASQPARLPEVAEAQADARLAHAFMRPSDLLAIREVLPRRATWRLDRDRLRADEAGPLFIRYTARITDETRLPGNFRIAVSYRMASLLAPRWTKSANRAEILREASDDYLDKAKVADRGHASPRPWNDPEGGCDWASEARR